MTLDETTRRKVADNIRKLKKESFRKLAQRAGLPFPTLSKVVYLQTKDIGLSILLKISRALGVSIDRLIR